jgi:hypothetical protein
MIAFTFILFYEIIIIYYYHSFVTVFVHIFKVLHLRNIKRKYINEIEVNETLVEKDLGILDTNDLRWDKHIIKMCYVASFAAKSIFKYFKHKSSATIGMIYKYLIRPKLEYANLASKNIRI